MYNELLSKLNSLKRKEKESDKYYMLPYDQGYITDQAIKQALVICHGIYIEKEQEIPSLYYMHLHVCRMVRSENLSAAHFLKYGQVTLAREFCQKEYEESDKALELLEKIIKEKEEDK